MIGIRNLGFRSFQECMKGKQNLIFDIYLVRIKISYLVITIYVHGKGLKIILHVFLRHLQCRLALCKCNMSGCVLIQ